MTEIIASFCAYWFISILCGFLAYLGYDTEIVAIYTILLIIDTFLGAVRAQRVDEKGFVSNKLTSGVIWKIVTLSVLLIVPLTLRGVGMDPLPLSGLILGVFILSECISSLTSIISIRKGKYIKERDFISDAIWLLIKFFYNVLERMLNTKR